MAYQLVINPACQSLQVKTLTSASSDARPAEVTQLALSPDGRQLASGYSDGTLRLWDFESGEPEQHASGHRSGVSALCYSQAGALLASGGQDTDVVVWDVTSGTPLYRLQGHLGQVTALVSSISSNRSLVAAVLSPPLSRYFVN